jgi:hypothetical protein
MTYPDSDSLLDLFQRITPDELWRQMEGKPGSEIYVAQAAMFGYLSGKVRSVLEQRLTMSADGAEYANGDVDLSLASGAGVSLSFDTYGLTLYGVKHGGKTLVPYLNTESISLNPGGDQTANFRAARPGLDQDVLENRLVVIGRNGSASNPKSGSGGIITVPYTTVTGSFDKWDVGRVLEIVTSTGGALDGERRQIASVTAAGYAVVSPAFSSGALSVTWRVLDLADVGLRSSNPADITGGNFPMLDLAVSDYDMKRKTGETDAQLRERRRILRDTTSPAAIRRALKRVMRRYAPGYECQLVNVLGGPEMRATLHVTGDDLTDHTAILDDPRDRPAWMRTRSTFRGHFVVRVPEWEPLPADITASQKKLTYKAIYDAMDTVRGYGVTFELKQDSTLG